MLRAKRSFDVSALDQVLKEEPRCSPFKYQPAAEQHPFREGKRVHMPSASNENGFVSHPRPSQFPSLNLSIGT